MNIPKNAEELEKFCASTSFNKEACPNCFAKNVCVNGEFFSTTFEKALIYHRKEKLKKLLNK